MAGIYIHIPFCRTACHYCNFHFSTNIQQKKTIIDALCAEISLQKDYLQGEQIKTIYFGGGTPSLLSFEEIKQILNVIEHTFSTKEVEEITLEANPEDLHIQKIKEYRTLGINRLSIGIQSFYEPHLKTLNRKHTGKDAITCVKNAKKQGFTNISIDIIYAIPHHNHTILIQDIATARDIAPIHISAYCLTIEEKTPFGIWVKKGKMKDIEENFAAEQNEILIDTLETAGYEQYEISNFAKENKYSLHNTAYWSNTKYLGIGPSAHSYNHSSRQYNIQNNVSYRDSIQKGIIPCEKEILTDKNRFNEYILTSIRTNWGTNLHDAYALTGIDILSYPEKIAFIQLCKKENTLVEKDNTLYLTKKGKLLADKITTHLMI